MNPALCTISLARDENEARLILNTVANLSGAGFRVIVADGGSPPLLVDSLRALPGVSLVRPSGPGLVAQVRTALAIAALETPFILYLESDKLLFAERHLADFLDRAPTAADVGAVVAGRSASSFASFPPVQQSAERRINEMTGAAIGQHGDYSYGPFLLNARLARHIDRAPASIGWGWRHFMFGLAHRLDYRVLHIVGDYRCPDDQRQEGDKEQLHRTSQLEQNIEGLRLALATPLN